MPVRIFNNIPSLNAQRILGINNERLAQSVERIASGIRVNRGADDAAGLAISERLRSDIRALRQGIRNANDGISLINVTEGGLNEQAGILIRLRELASQASTGTVGDSERQTINLEFSALRSEIDRIAFTTEFNGQKLLDGSLSNGGTVVLSTNPTTSASGVVTFTTTTQSGAVNIQIGKDADVTGAFNSNAINLNTDVNLQAITSNTLVAGSSAPSFAQGASLTQLNVNTQQSAVTALAAINNYIDTVTAGRGKVGAVQNRLVRAISNQSISVENLQAAESAIRDADIAEEVALFTRNQILVQSSTAMVGQANLIPQAVLQLLG